MIKWGRLFLSHVICLKVGRGGALTIKGVKNLIFGSPTHLHNHTGHGPFPVSHRVPSALAEISGDDSWKGASSRAMNVRDSRRWI